MRPLPRSFYRRETLLVARDLLGVHLCHQLVDEEHPRSGRIVEVEAYLGLADKASHARARERDGVMVPYGRSVVMFGPSGVAYVYVIYGMHHCLNVVAHPEGVVGAVLIRALEPGPALAGADCRGPGRLCKALALDRRHNGLDLCGEGRGEDAALGRLWLADAGTAVADEDVVTTPRIGVDYAGDHALLPYRFCDRRSRWLSRRLPAQQVMDL